MVKSIQDIIQNSQDAIILSDPDSGQIQEVNKAARYLSGFSDAQLYKIDWTQLVILDGQDDLHQLSLIKSGFYHGECWLKKKSGEVIKIELSAYKIEIEGLTYVHNIIREIDDRDSKNSLTIKYNNILLEIINDSKFYSNDLNCSYEMICKMVSKALFISQITIWVFHKTKHKLICRNKYTLGGFHDGNKIEKNNCPKYIQLMEDGLSMDVIDAKHDLRVSELYSNYVLVNGITSLLDATIRFKGKFTGVISCEHLGEELRHWTIDEVNFIQSVSNLITHIYNNFELQVKNQELNKSSKKYQDIFNSLIDIYYRTNNRNELIVISPSVLEQTGFSEKETLKKKAEDFFAYPEELAQFKIKLFKDKELKNFEVRMLNAKKEERVISMNVRLEYDLNGNYMGTVGMLRDITDNKKSENKLRETSQKYENLIEYSNDAILITNSESRLIVVANKAAEKLIGYTKNEFYYMKMIDLRPEYEKKNTLRQSKEIKKIGHLIYESLIQTKDGHVINVEMSTRRIFIGDELYHQSFIRDCTERKRTEKELKYMEEMLQETSRVSGIGGWEYDIVTQNIYWSEVTKNIYGVTNGYIPDYESTINFYKEGFSRKMIVESIKNGIDKSLPWDVELKIITTKGREIWINSKGKILKEKGKVVKLYGTIQDIDERKNSGERLKKSERNLKRAEKLAQVGNWQYVGKTRETHCSDELYHIFGLPNIKSAPVSVIFDTVHPLDRSYFNYCREQLLRGVHLKSFDYRIIVNGKIKYLESFQETEISEGYINLFGTIQEITERRTLENKLQTKNAHLRVLFRIEKALSEHIPIEQFSNKVCEILIEELNYEIVQLAIVSLEEQSICKEIGLSSLLPIDHYEPKIYNQYSNVKITNSEVQKHGIIGITHDINTLNNFEEYSRKYQDSDVRSLIVIPFWYTQEISGVLNIYLHEIWEYNKDEVNFLKQIVNAFALGIHSIKINREKNELFNFNTHLISSLNLVSVRIYFKKDQISYNGSCRSVLGYSNQEMGVSLSDFKNKMHPFDLMIFEQNIQSANQARIDIECRILRPISDYKWVNLLGQLHFDEKNELIEMSGIIMNIDDKKNAENIKIKAEIRGKDLERKRIAEEIHDSLGQTLTVASLSLESLKKDVLILNKDRIDLFKNAQDLLHKAIIESRDISHNLMPSSLKDFGLVAALETDIVKTNKFKDIEFAFFHQNIKERLDLDIEMNLYKICMEAINNILKYSKATVANLQLMVMDQMVVLMIEDNGIGFDPYHINDGIGLLNMKNRVKSINGEIHIESSNGVIITIEVPLKWKKK